MPPTSSTGPSPTLPERPAALALLLLATLLAHANGLLGAYQFDDYRVIVEAAEVHRWAAWYAGLGHGLRPLLKASYTLNWSLDESPLGFHVFNLLTHLANVLLVRALVLAWGKDREALAAVLPAVAWTTALWFAVHPIHCEAVTYLSGRSASLVTLAFLGGLLAHARGRPSLALLLFGAAALVKESALLFPLALVVWDRSRGLTWSAILVRHRAYWCLAAAVALAGAMVPAYRMLFANAWAPGDAFGNLAVQLDAVTDLVARLFWPAGLDIDPDYASPVRFGVSVLEAGALAGLALFAWHRRRQMPWLGFALAWSVVHLLLLNTLLPRADVANERLLYWASWAPLMACSFALHLRLQPRPARLIGLAAAVVLALLTVERNADYRSEIALWEQTVRQSPNKARVWNNLGYAYQQAGRGADAAIAYRRALALDPDYLKAANNLERLSESVPRQGD